MVDTKDFRAITRYTERNNGVNAKSWVIAADIGYSGVKIMSPTILACFPSFAMRLDDSYGVIGDLPETHILYTDLETGEKWLVGKDAQDSISDRDTSISERALFGRDRYEDPMFKVIIRVGLAAGLSSGKYGSPTGKKIVIQTGYPPQYKTDEEDIREVFSGIHHFAVKIGDNKEVEYDFTIDPENVFLMPQPMGTLFSVTVDRDGKSIPKMVDCLKKSVLVFDAGFGTLDLFPIKASRLQQSQTNDNLGMKQVLKETVSELEATKGISIDVPALQKYLDTGMVRYHKKRTSYEVPFGDILQSSSKKVCEQAINWVMQVYPLYDFDYLVITGGTGAAWQAIIREEFKDMETLKIICGNENDTIPFVFANVRGYYLYRFTKIRLEEKANS